MQEENRTPQSNARLWMVPLISEMRLRRAVQPLTDTEIGIRN